MQVQKSLQNEHRRENDTLFLQPTVTETYIERIIGCGFLLTETQSNPGSSSCQDPLPDHGKTDLDTKICFL